jgi:hypothetical protein
VRGWADLGVHESRAALAGVERGGLIASPSAADGRGYPWSGSVVGESISRWNAKTSGHSGHKSESKEFGGIGDSTPAGAATGGRYQDPLEPLHGVEQILGGPLDGLELG